jgi:hypothetical protein
MTIKMESITLPAWSLTKEERLSLYITAKGRLIQEAQSRLHKGDLIVRALRPTDLGETNDVWAETVTATGNAWEASQIADQQIPDEVMVCLYGLIDTSDPQAVTGVRITAGAGLRAEWDMFPIIGSDPHNLELRTMYAQSPVIISPNMTVKIEYYVRAFSPQVILGAEIVLMGLTAEYVGRTLQP